LSTPREQLASKLKELRRRSGLSGDRLASQTGLSQPKVSRIEAARSLPSLDEVRRWAQATGATSEELTELAVLAEQVAITATSWRILHKLGLAERQYQLRDLELQARRILTFQPVVIPGLLQIAEYARRVMSMGYSGAADPKAVAARMERQAVLYDQTKQFEFVITEGALLFQPGSPELTQQQRDRLLSVASMPNVTIAVLPFDRAPVPFLNQFVLWDLPEETLVTAETFATELQIREPGDVARYQQVWSLVTDKAIDLHEWQAAR
jgi:transcriptional regulator with XRE-family HTH domain